MRAGFVLLIVFVLGGCARSTPPPDTAPRPVSAPPSTEPRVVTLGASVRGVPIAMHMFGNGPDAVLVFSAIHGDEPSAAYVGRSLLDHLLEHPELAAGRAIALIPITNPDGVAAGTRTNANGVDCNRNFPAANWKRRPGFLRSNPGKQAASEPETLAVMKAVELVNPTRILSIHSGLHCNNYDGPAAYLAALMARHNGYPVRGSVGYPTPGSFGSWAGIDRGLPVVTLELPRHNNGPRAWAENREGILAVISADRDLTQAGEVVKK